LSSGLGFFGGRQEILEGVKLYLVMEYSVADPDFFFSDPVNLDLDLDPECFQINAYRCPN
jgi:hypothetical protein